MECAEAGFLSAGAHGLSSLGGDRYSRFSASVSASVRVWILSPAPSSCAHVPYVQLAGGLLIHVTFFMVYNLRLDCRVMLMLMASSHRFPALYEPSV